MGSPDSVREGFACDGAAVVALSGEIDLDSATAVYRSVVRKAGRDCAVLDLSRVAFIDASGISVFMRLLKQTTLQGRHLLLAAPTPAVSRVFDVLGLDETFEIHPTVTSAAAAHPVFRVSSATGPQRPPAAG